MQQNLYHNEWAFSLIEILIVVLIIAILAAIAIPNFLLFQNRAKMARVANDQRAIATALEAYYIENGSYPRDHLNHPGSNNRFDINFPLGLFYLTTPVAYMTTVAEDSFATRLELAEDPNFVAPNYTLACGSDNMRFSGVRNSDSYVVISMGPDLDEIDTGRFEAFPWGGREAYFKFFDPTNGVVSQGDLYRFGGNYRDGDYVIGDPDEGTVPWNKWGNFGPQTF